ncbi:MAG: hypothetical protein OQK63_05475 [Ignavibacteriaceae bacterium]|nr:hypothetical protein [Ignavibacteriaceae bacterium]MCW8960897.1 hypothetical protein [Ignavibacteriaceae bacterium]
MTLQLVSCHGIAVMTIGRDCFVFPLIAMTKNKLFTSPKQLSTSNYII